MASKIEPHPEAFAYGKGQRRPRQQSGKHLEWIRTLPSVISWRHGCEAAHIRYGSPEHGKRETGIQEKPDDKWVLPLTADEHRKQHSQNEREWWRGHGIDPLDIALRLWAVSGDDEAGAAIIRGARSGNHGRGI